MRSPCAVSKLWYNIGVEGQPTTYSVTWYHAEKENNSQAPQRKLCLQRHSLQAKTKKYLGSLVVCGKKVRTTFPHNKHFKFAQFLLKIF